MIRANADEVEIEFLFECEKHDSVIRVVKRLTILQFNKTDTWRTGQTLLFAAK